jgi:ribosome maturation factor RimP
MIDSKKIESLAESQLVGTDVFVVSCKVSPSNEVELLLDSDTSVQLELCASVNRAIVEALGEPEDVALTVASAGIGEELKCLRQYKKLVGHSVEVLLKDGTKILAILDAVDEQGITLGYEERQTVEGKKRKQLVKVVRQYIFDEMKYTKEYLDFK